MKGKDNASRYGIQYCLSHSSINDVLPYFLDWYKIEHLFTFLFFPKFAPYMNLELKTFLDEKVQQYKTPQFIKDDPIQIPLSFSSQQDQEIAAFFAALIAWGNRKSIIKDGNHLMDLMDRSPYQFVMNYENSDLEGIEGSLHRTFMAEDFRYLIQNLKRLYQKKDSLEEYFLPQKDEQNLMNAIERFRTEILSQPHRASKHISSPAKGSAAKRLHMFLRWMVRNDEVDLGVWKQIPSSLLSLPLDTHTLRVAQKLGLSQRKNNHRKTVEAIDSQLRRFDAKDPVKYDFALFGLGVYEKF